MGAPERKKKAVLFGGSFSPPHRGHAAFAAAAARHGDELWVLPSGDRSDKAPGLAEARLAMSEAFARDLAAATGVPVRVETIELELPPPTWTYRTIKELEARYPDYRFAFAASSEILPHVRASWEDGAALWGEAEFVLALRPGHPAPDDAPPTCSWMAIECPVDVSSTEIRARLARGEDVAHLLTPEVAELVRRGGYYRPEAR
jgi:nicotinate-nucleotide adenylyltransferase